MTRMDYFVKKTVVSIYTDHANLVYIYDPIGPNPGLPRHTMSKLMQWIKLSEFRFVIEHLQGSRNVWVDMLTRWAVQPWQETSTSHRKTWNKINGPFHSLIIRITLLADNSVNQNIATKTHLSKTNKYKTCRQPYSFQG